VAMVLIAWWAAVLSPAHAAALDSSLAIGSATTLWSDALQEQRRILVQLPRHYHESAQAYPVLYVLDAETQFHAVTGAVQSLSVFSERIPEMIVIGVTNTLRSRDLTPRSESPEDLKYVPESGGADAFLRFLHEELQPWVAARYRTQPYRVLWGHSFGGLFTAYALLTRPQAFDAYLAISPSLHWDAQALPKRFERAGRTLRTGAYLFLCWGDNEPRIEPASEQLVAVLKNHAPAGLRWDHRYYPGEDHRSTPHRSLHDALEAVFTGWALPSRRQNRDVQFSFAEVDAHYAALSKKFGFSVTPPARVLINVGHGLLERNDDAGGMAQLRRAVREYPYLAEARGALGDALATHKQIAEARIAYLDALRAAVAEDPENIESLQRYRQKLRQLDALQPLH
ncbi:alpha/beta hydrolase, partial [Steroidobacter sp.]|uniref:alpha/beta hydrolase n=1 Tax=Steroidobacter sp. TaxID=1978227 RepID=UPI001A4BD1FE